MKIDELRRELHQAAMEIEPFPADPAPVRNHVRNRRLAIGAAVLVVALATPIALAVARRDPANVTAASAKSVGLDALHTRNALVSVPRNGDSAAVARDLDGLDSVVRYTTLAVGLPSQLNPGSDVVCADSGGFIVELRHGTEDVDALRAALSGHATVDSWSSVAKRTGFANSRLEQSQKAPEIEVFMSIDATPDQVALVRQRVEHDTDVARFTYLDKQAAFAEFKRIFKDQPALIASTTADALPESFRIVPKDASKIDLLAQHYSGLPGIDEILNPADMNPCK